MKKILIAEDDRYLANAYRLLFKGAGFDIKIASDGVETLFILKEFTPDLILLDLIMPNKDGYAVLKELKSDENWKKIPVWITSNLGQKNEIERGMKLGAEKYIVKSDISMEDLLNEIKKFLS